MSQYIRNKEEDITMDSLGIKIIQEYNEWLCTHKSGNLDEIDRFLERYKMPKVSQEIYNLNGPMPVEEVLSINKHLKKESIIPA